MQRTGQKIINVIGAPATGKTTLRRALAKATGLPSYGIDDERIRLLRPGRWWPEDDRQSWRNLWQRIGDQDCIVETCNPIEHSASLLTVRCMAAQGARRVRLGMRVGSGYRLAQGRRNYIEQLMRVSDPASGDCEWDGTKPHGLDGLLSAVETFLKGRAGREVG